MPVVLLELHSRSVLMVPATQLIATLFRVVAMATHHTHAHIAHTHAHTHHTHTHTHTHSHTSIRGTLPEETLCTCKHFVHMHVQSLVA